MSEETAIDKFAHIDIERTIAEFGYDPSGINFPKKNQVFSFCKYCGEDKGLQTFFNAMRDIKCRKCFKKPNGDTVKEKFDISKTIDVEKTISTFKYDPRHLSKGSKRKVVVCCDLCKKYRNQSFNESFVVKKCIECEFKNRSWTEEAKIKQSNRKKGIKFTEEHKKRIGIANTGRKVSAETRSKIAKKAIGRPKSIETRKKLSGSNCHFFGKLPTSKTSKSGWYERKDGSKIFMRSSWERAYAKYLDDSDINWEYECKAFSVKFFSELSNFTKEGFYHPDFYVNGEWFEVKGYWRDDSKPKFEAFKEQYPEEKITLLMKPELLALGIDVR